MRSIVILGAGGSGRGVVDIVQSINAEKPTWHFLGYLDDDRRTAPLAPLGGLADLDVDAYVISIANPELRARYDSMSPPPAVLVHPSAVIAKGSSPGPGAIVRGNATVAPDVNFGRHNYVNMNATVGHDVTMGDYVTVHPGANISGYVELGEGVTLGAGSVVLPGLRIGAYAYVGAGAVVTRDVAHGTVVTGAPARAR